MLKQAVPRQYACQRKEGNEHEDHKQDYTLHCNLFPEVHLCCCLMLAYIVSWDSLFRMFKGPVECSWTQHLTAAVICQSWPKHWSLSGSGSAAHIHVHMLVTQSGAHIANGTDQTLLVPKTTERTNASMGTIQIQW